jgi:hypothetical protein
VIDVDNDDTWFDLPYNQMNITVFQSMRFSNKGKGPKGSPTGHGIGEINLDNPVVLETLKPYIKIAYKWTEVDWNVNPPHGKFDEHYFDAKTCTQSDFGTHKNVPDYLKLWKGYSMICPDFESTTELPDDTWTFKGSISSFEIDRAEFVVERC